MKKSLKRLSTLSLSALTIFALASCKDAGAEESVSYTYNGVYTGNFVSWSPHDREMSTDAIISGLVNDSLYTFNLNEERNGYQIGLGMASEMPSDVTSLYAGDYQVPEGATANYAYRVTLRDNLMFEDGSTINADDFLGSYERLIDTNTFHYNSAGYENGNLIISGSAYYKKRGKTEEITLTNYAKYEGVNLDEYYNLNQNSEARINFIDLGYVYSKEEKEGFEAYNGYYRREAESTDNLVVDSGFTLAELKSIAENHNLNYADLVRYNYTYRTDSFENTVGLVKIDDLTFDVISDKALSEFYFVYSIGSWLVNNDLYDSLKEYTEDGSYISRLGTSVETTSSYGPYKLVSYIDNKEFRLERNPYWYGYTLPENEGLYQTTNIYYQRIDESQTQLQSFLKGDLDEITLNSTTVKEYLMSEALLQMPTMYTMEFFMNSNYDMLVKSDSEGKTKNSVLFSYDSFREGMTYSLDRESFAQTVSAGCISEAMMFNNLYITDPDTGEVYRNTESAKEAYQDSYNGATNANDTYQPAYAMELFNQTYLEATENGDYQPGSDISIIVATSDSSSECQAIATYLAKALNDILSDTNETYNTNYGKVDVTLNGSDGSERYDYLLTGKYTMMWGGWSSSALSPFTYLRLYFDPSYNYCPGFNGNEMGFEAQLSDMDSPEYHSYMEWYNLLNTGRYLEADASLKTELLALMEVNFISEYQIIPMYAKTNFELLSDKIEYGTDTYVTVVGFGGIKYMTYNFTDSEWEAHVKENADSAGNLDYKN